MRALIYRQYNTAPLVEEVPDPALPADGVIVAVRASGICRSDWHGWKGHDPDIQLPHVPGHEFAGEVMAVGSDVRSWTVGDRVTVPFVVGCGRCRECLSGNQQVCDDQFQPGFTNWGSFAQYVSIPRADSNLVRLPDDMSYDAAASLGCRFATAFRAIVDVSKVSGGEWVAIYGCGGAGLSAIAIAKALGAKVVAVDVSKNALDRAKLMGADFTISAKGEADVAAAVVEASGGGVHVSMDALGHTETCVNSILSLRKRGRHVQVGLMLAEHSGPPIPMGAVIGKELSILGSHGMQAHRYDAMLAFIRSSAIMPEQLIGDRVSLAASGPILTAMDKAPPNGVTVITEF